MSDPETPKQGEPCEECGAPLATDQRYCLHCGRRRGEPRADYRHYMALGSAPAEPRSGEPGAAPAGSAPAEEPAAGQQRDFAPLAAVAGIAVLGLMLLVGVLIGRGDGETAAAPAPQIVRVQGGGEEAGSAAGGAKDASGGLLGGGNAKKGKANGGGEDGTPDTGSAVKASESDLEALEADSGESYAKKSEELPNEIATPGAPPPIDKSTPPGGGEGGGEVIK